MAMLKLCNDPDWKRIGGRFLCPVHDELIVEVPFEFREEGAQILARCMCDAGNFLPFKLTCDVETTFRWYGLTVEDVLSYDKPDTYDKDTFTESNIKWLQCMVIENEFILPTYPDKDGNKPIGIAAHGVNGIWSDELEQAIDVYCRRYGVEKESTFLDHIEKKVIYGVY